MGTTQPIKELAQINELKDFYFSKNPNYRNYALICLGVNSALRIGDLLLLQWGQVYDLEQKCYKEHIAITEQKTQKKTRIAINDSAIAGLEVYRKSLKDLKAEDYIFPGKNGRTRPLSRSQAFRIIKRAAKELHFEDDISCHSLRKTFGYHAWKRGVHPAILTEIYNHASYQVTRRYLGINQDDKDDIFKKMNL